MPAKTREASTARANASAQDDYLALVRRHPLRKIASQAEADAALRVLSTLLGHGGLRDGEREYAEALATLIADYERRSLPPAAKVTPAELLKHLMQESKLSVGDVGRIIGSAPAASMILRGQRSISKAQARRLADRFDLDVGAFIE
jgi:antitoxin component HigA of HigAB toxin-antitoxin module